SPDVNGLVAPPVPASRTPIVITVIAPEPDSWLAGFQSARERNTTMGIFDKAKDAAGQAAEQHGDKIDQGIDQAGDFADEKTGGKYSDQVDQGQDAAKSFADNLG